MSIRVLKHNCKSLCDTNAVYSQATLLPERTIKWHLPARFCCSERPVDVALPNVSDLMASLKDQQPGGKRDRSSEGGARIAGQPSATAQKVREQQRFLFWEVWFSLVVSMEMPTILCSNVQHLATNRLPRALCLRLVIHGRTGQQCFASSWQQA